jgi:hypothetical protein
MKKLLWMALAIFTLNACNNEEKNPELERLEMEKEALIKESSSKDSTINSFLESLNEIEDNLVQVKQKQSNVIQSSKSGAELGGSAKDRINEDISFINELMEENKKKLASLQSKLKNSNLKIGEFEKTIKRMSEQLLEKDQEITTLKEQLVNMNFQIEQLNQTLVSEKSNSEAKSRTIEQQTGKLNTAYYAIGTYKELRDNKVLDKTGGFLGLGKSKSLKPDFNQNYFTQIDVTKIKTIAINAKNAKIVTNHLAGSYEFDSDKKIVKALMIKNYDDFWKSSKYLVVVVEK